MAEIVLFFVVEPKKRFSWRVIFSAHRLMLLRNKKNNISLSLFTKCVLVCGSGCLKHNCQRCHRICWSEVCGFYQMHIKMRLLSFRFAAQQCLCTGNIAHMRAGKHEICFSFFFKIDQTTSFPYSEKIQRPRTKAASRTHGAEWSAKVQKIW